MTTARVSLCLALVLAFSAVCYLPLATHRAEFVFDDRRGILSNPDLRSDTQDLWLHDYWASFFFFQSPRVYTCSIRLLFSNRPTRTVTCRPQANALRL